LHALHVVFLARIQAACDDFVEMWNNHRIRGPPTESGRGGGIPNELFLHRVSTDQQRDDASYQALGDNGCAFSPLAPPLGFIYCRPFVLGRNLPHHLALHLRCFDRRC
jgi:hypothetical protein